MKNKIRATRAEVNSDHTKLMKCVADAEKQVALEVTAIIEEKMQAAEEQLNIAGVYSRTCTATQLGEPFCLVGV